MTQLLDDTVGLMRSLNFLTDLVLLPPDSPLDYVETFTDKLVSLLATSHNENKAPFFSSELQVMQLLSDPSNSELEGKITDKQVLSQVRSLMTIRMKLLQIADQKERRDLINEAYATVLRYVFWYCK